MRSAGWACQQLRIIGQRLVQRMGVVEVGVGRGGRRADQVVIVVLGDDAGHHVLAGVLVAAVTGETLLVAVVDDGHAAPEVHQGMGQLVAGHQFSIGGTGVVLVAGRGRYGRCRGCRGTVAARRRCCRCRCSSRRSA